MEFHIIYGRKRTKHNIEKHSLMLLNDAMQVELNAHLKQTVFYLFICRLAFY